MSENEHSTARGSDPDDAPDLTGDGWPEKFVQGESSPGPAAGRQAQGINHDPPLAGRDRLLQGRWPGLANTNR